MDRRRVIEKDYSGEIDKVNRIQRREKEMNNGIIASRIDTIKDDKLILCYHCRGTKIPSNITE